MSRPWMPLYVGDYIADTAHLSAAQHGAYLLLMMHYWQKNSLPADDQSLARIAKMTNAEWRKSRPVLRAFFSECWKHKRIEFELSQAARISAAGRAGGIASGEVRRRRATVERPLNDRTNDLATNLQRSTNDQGNDLATKREALQLHSQPQRKEEERKNAREKPRASPAFDTFWERYPNRIGKDAARKAFEKIEKSGRVSIENLMIGLEKYVRKTDDRPWCNPATWLNQGRWDDQPAAGVQQNGNGKSLLGALDRLEESLSGSADYSAREDDFLGLPPR